MKDQVFNPFLPSWEYIPDGEPRKFDGRIYVYGSHDRFDGRTFCMNDYVCWSAPQDDLSDWRYEGVIFQKRQDPHNRSGRRCLYAPDVCRGPDGRYYLYYFVGYDSRIGVAVSPTPAGKYEFLGYVSHSDGTPLGRKKGDCLQFDPGVYVEGDDVYLYTGFCPVHYPVFLTRGRKISRKGAMVTRLLPDMVTVAAPTEFIGECKRSGKGTAFEGHEFFEAASMRKINGRYYFIYSSFLGHELCYAVSDKPDGGFEYGGTIVSIGDVGLYGRSCVKEASDYCGNTHGSIVEAMGKYYIFYHRQTNRHCFSRQACAERISIGPDGRIAQVETTSCGLNGGPLAGKGKYEARIACNLFSRKGSRFYGVFKGFKGAHPFFTQSGRDRQDNPDQYIANMTDGSEAAFKYFRFDGEARSLAVRLRGSCRGTLSVYARPVSWFKHASADMAEPGEKDKGAERTAAQTEKERAAAVVHVTPSKNFTEFTATLSVGEGIYGLSFVFSGRGRLDFDSFELK